MAANAATKIALVGDVHANLPALEAVLAHARERGVSGVWNIGDFLGYGAYPDEVVKRFRQEGTISIIGNYDLKVLKFPQKDKKWRTTKHPLKWLAFKWAYEQLSSESLDYLRSLPEEKHLTAGGRNFLLVHASPASNEEALVQETPGERLAELNRLAVDKYGRKFDAIIFGHSHQGFARLIDGAWFINTGSAGRPGDGDPRACYAVMEITAEGIKVEHFRLEYDVDRAVAAIRKKGLPEAFAEMLIQGRELETVLTDPLFK
jgi:putative phosphoesterase